MKWLYWYKSTVFVYITEEMFELAENKNSKEP